MQNYKQIIVHFHGVSNTNSTLYNDRPARTRCTSTTTWITHTHTPGMKYNESVQGEPDYIKYFKDERRLELLLVLQRFARWYFVGVAAVHYVPRYPSSRERREHREYIADLGGIDAYHKLLDSSPCPRSRSSLLRSTRSSRPRCRGPHLRAGARPAFRTPSPR